MDDFKNIQWPGWNVTRLIGRGSFGAVYEIERDLFGKKEKAALKHIGIPQNSSDVEELYNDGYDEESISATFQSHLESIVAEYSLMRKLNGAANVVNCDDVQFQQRTDGIGWDIYIKMELLTPLSKALPDPIPEETTVKLACDMCRALALCKRFDIIHRDIKPQNIFVSPLGDYKLGDFGIAKTVEKTMGGTKTGTYKYMAPEVYNNRPYGHQADIYSLGLVLYWMLNRRRMPFLPLPPARLTAGMDEQARSRRLSGEPLPPPADGCEALKRIVLKACAYDPKDRYRSAEEMLAELEELGGGSTGRVSPVNAESDERNESVVTPAAEPVSSRPEEEKAAYLPGCSGNNSGANELPVQDDSREVEAATVGLFGASSAIGNSFSVPADHKTAAAAEPEKEATVDAIGGCKTPESEAASAVGNGFIVGGAASSAEKSAQAAPVLNAQTESTKKKRGAVIITAVAACLALLIGGVSLLKNRDQGTSNSGQQSGQKDTSSFENANAGQKNTEDVLSEINILAMPNQTEYFIGESLNTSGMQLRATYSSGLNETITSGFNCSPSTLNSPGTQSITVSYGGKNTTFSVSVKMQLEMQPCKISVSYYHSVGLRTDGTAVAVGSNTDGRCNVSKWKNLVAISAGYCHTVGLRSDGTAVAVGSNEYGQCDVNGWTDLVAISAGYYHTVGLRSDGTAVAVGSNEYGQCDIKGWTDLVAISAGCQHTVGLRADGTVVAVGWNEDGQCDVNSWKGIVSISAGALHTVGLRADGTAVAVGVNDYGQCDVSGLTELISISAGTFHTVGLQKDGTAVAVGFNQNNVISVSDWTNLVAISTSHHHTLGLLSNGTVVVTGNNGWGQCDVGDWCLN